MLSNEESEKRSINVACDILTAIFIFVTYNQSKESNERSKKEEGTRKKSVLHDAVVSKQGCKVRVWGCPPLLWGLRAVLQLLGRFVLFM